MNNIGKRISELIDYLGISTHEFAMRCDIASGQMVTFNIESNKPSLNTLEKIMKRYPVNSSWLLLNTGTMWKKDYFQDRFENINSNPKTASHQIEVLLQVFEMNQRQFCNKTGVGTCTLSAIKKGERIEVSKNVRDKICKAYPFIKPTWFYI